MTKHSSKKNTKKNSSDSSSVGKLQDKVQVDHRRLVRSVFRGAGFARVSGVSDKEFIYDNQPTDFDDVFVFENIVVLAEYTIRRSQIGDHLKTKKLPYDKIFASSPSFVKFISSRFPKIGESSLSNYHVSKVILRIVYCSRYDFDSAHKLNVPGPIYMDYPIVRYFTSVTQTIKLTSRHELLAFLNVDSKSVGINGLIDVSSKSKEYKGSILPEAHSNFDEGYKVVSFYVDPGALLRTAYVLRKDGWQDSINLYQRMISGSKIEAIRQYLKRQKRVFINNVIVTLPPEVKPLNAEGQTVDATTLTSTEPVEIKLPDRPNTVGLIDGQHRVFAYHETKNDDVEIASLRRQQNLLVTGIIYLEGISITEREKFEARLFLEINSNQTNAKTDLKQAIGVVLEPFSADSVAARVMAGLAESGPLAGYVARYFFDKDKLKTSSIVSFGLRPLVKTSGQDSLFSLWIRSGEIDFINNQDYDKVPLYVKFCCAHINIILNAVKSNVSSDRWKTDKKVPNRLLTTTYINSFVIMLRLLIGKGQEINYNALAKKLTGIENFNFSVYHSSQYARMADAMVKDFFEV